MKKVLLVLLILVIAACTKRTDQITVTGTDGRDGYSVVSEFAQSSELECQTSGTRLDMYLDLDRNLMASDGDQYLNSIIACNGASGINGLDGTNGTDGEDGAQGPQGEMGPQGLQGFVGPAGPDGSPGVQGPVGPTGSQGPQGLQGVPGTNGASSVTIALYSSNSCTKITGSSPSVYVKVQGSNVQFFNSSSCHSSTKLAEVSQGESFWVSSRMLAIYDDESVRVITFN